MSAQIGVFGPFKATPSVHDGVHCLRVETDGASLTLYFGVGFDPSEALHEIDALIYALDRLRDEVVEKAPKPEAVTA